MAKSTNPWIIHLGNVRKTLSPATSLKQAMQVAKKTYKKGVKVLTPFKVNKKTNKKRYGRRRSNKMRGGSEGDLATPKLV